MVKRQIGMGEKIHNVVRGFLNALVSRGSIHLQQQYLS
jgi:hypothetical protein